ncbi:MAG: hypothetical protein CMJ83_04825 [Planctomycetes bacterium]|nr:hypothetical protein [Planctomycetota bacterium]
MIARYLLPALSLFAVTANAQDGAWPGFRGPGRDGIAPSAKPLVKWSDDEGVRWKTELPGPGSSSPIVVGDCVYVACYSGFGYHLENGGEMKDLKHHLVCVERSSGKIVWDCIVPGPLEKRPPRVQIVEHGFASPTPVCDGKAIYAYFGRAGVVAISLEGKVLWKEDLGLPSPDAPAATNSVERGGRRISLRWGAAASPLLHDGLVIVNSSEENNAIQAFDKKTGKVVWKRESANLEGTAISPMLAGPASAPYVLMALGGEIWALQPKTGKLLWSVETDTRGGMSSTSVADEEMIYVFGGEGKNYTLRIGAKDGASRVAWRSKNVEIPSPVLYDGKLFLVNMQGMGVCMNAKDGEVLFDGRLEGRTSQVYASPVLADGRLYVVTRKRGVFVYSADGKFSLQARNELTDGTQFNASPAIVGDQIYLRSDKQLFCLAGK